MTASGPAAFFDARADRYDAAYDARSADGHALRARMAVALELLGPGPGLALDAGMGAARLCAELEARGWTATGIDGSAEMVALARRRLPHARERLLQADIERLPFPDGTFDAVVATGVLEYADVRRALAEISRVLRPHGLAVVSYPNRHSLYGLWKTRVFYRLVRPLKRLSRRGGSEETVTAGSGALSPAAFRELLLTRGLSPVCTEYASFLVLPSPLEILLPRAADRVGRAFEGSGPRLGHRLAAQVVYAARRTEGISAAPGGSD